MKNGCEILEDKNSETNERAKKLHRYVSDIARRLSEATAACKTNSELFSLNLEIQRQKLRDNCEKLLFLDSLNYGKKSIDLLWRKVYYDTVVAAKKLRETDNSCDNYLFTHIVCGIGQFHHFIDRIQTKIKKPFQELDYFLSHNDEEAEDVVCIPTEEDLQFARVSIHSFLIYLGDLCRYQAEIFHTFDPSIAARYYLQAAHINMSSGMPFNQLGNLYLDKNYNLDSVCYYIHCLSCIVPFEGALGNLEKIFSKNNQFYENVDENQTLSQTEHIQNTVSKFLSLIEIWYMNKNDTNISQRCSIIAQDIKIALDFTMNPLPDINKNYLEYTQALEEENINPSYLNGNLMHKIVQICLFTMAKLTESDVKKAFACKAFSLALLSQMLQKLLKQLVSMGLENPASKYKPRTSSKEIESIQPEQQPDSVDATDIKDSVALPVDDQKSDVNKIEEPSLDTEDSKKLPNGDLKTIKKASSKRRRRRRITSSESSDFSDEDTEGLDMDEYSSEDELSDSSYSEEAEDKSDISDIEDSDNDVNGTVNGNHSDNDQTETKLTNHAQNNNEKPVEAPEQNIEIDGKNQIKEKQLQNFLLGDNFLPSLKLLQDWVLTEKDLILSCGDSGESLFQCVVDLLNIFSFYFNNKNNNFKTEESKILAYAESIARKLKLEYKRIPLPEDLNLRGTNICKFDKDAAEWQILDRYKPTVYEENIIRILDFIDFGTQIAKIVPRIRFNRSMKIFYLKRIPQPKVNTKNNHKRTREWHNSKKIGEAGEGGLLRRLGRLWLTSQVRELERSGQVAPPALLALDTAALHKHLRRVKQLLHTRNFIFLIPAVVLQELDELKRDQSTARDAIRWLEIQLRSGSRFLRAQRPGQSKPLPLLKYPRKAPPHVHNFVQILEFCNYFISDEKQNQTGSGDSEGNGKSTPFLILLVGNEPGREEEQYTEFSLTGAAQSAGISMEYICDFYSKWRQTNHKSGKKR